jgi:hypothetical protein
MSNLRANIDVLDASILETLGKKEWKWLMEIGQVKKDQTLRYFKTRWNEI